MESLHLVLVSPIDCSQCGNRMFFVPVSPQLMSDSPFLPRTQHMERFWMGDILEQPSLLRLQVILCRIFTYITDVYRPTIARLVHRSCLRSRWYRDRARGTPYHDILQASHSPLMSWTQEVSRVFNSVPLTSQPAPLLSQTDLGQIKSTCKGIAGDHSSIPRKACRFNRKERNRRRR